MGGRGGGGGGGAFCDIQSKETIQLLRSYDWNNNCIILLKSLFLTGHTPWTRLRAISKFPFPTNIQVGLLNFGHAIFSTAILIKAGGVIINFWIIISAQAVLIIFFWGGGGGGGGG